MDAETIKIPRPKKGTRTLSRVTTLLAAHKTCCHSVTITEVCPGLRTSFANPAPE